MYSTGLNKSGSINIDARYYSGMEGTSQAAAVVAGVAALLAKYTDCDTPDEIEKRLISTASPLKENGLGAGCIDALAAFEGFELPSNSSEIHNNMSAPSMEVILLDKDKNILANNASISFKDNISFRIEDDVYSKDTKFYYTLNGNLPNPDNMTGTGTKLANTNEYRADSNKVISLMDINSSKVTVKVLPVLYGRKGNVCTFSLYNNTEKVNDIEINCKTTIPDKDDVYHLAVGKTLQFTATTLPTYIKNNKVEWISDNTSFVTVSSSGLVKALSETPANGSVKISAVSTDSGISKDIYIISHPLTQYLYVENNQTNIDLEAGSTKEIDTTSDGIKCFPGSVSRIFTFNSSNPAVATVDKDGLITAHSSGTAIITVSASDGSGLKDTINVTVTTPIQTLELTMNAPYTMSNGEKMYEIPVDSQKKYLINAIFNEGISKPDIMNLSWNSNSTYNNCDVNYEICNKGNGTADFTLKALNTVSNIENRYVEIEVEASNGISGSLKFIPYYSATGIEYEKTFGCSRAEMNLGEETDIVNTSALSKEGLGYYVYSDGHSDNTVCQSVTFKSGNPKVVSVDCNGHLKALSKGNTVITLTTHNNKTLTFKISVVDPTKDKVLSYGLQSKNPVEIIYPGKSIKYNVISNKGNYDSYFNKLYSKGHMKIMCASSQSSMIDINKLTIKGNNNITEDQKSTISLSEYNSEENIWREINRVPIELYPSAVGSVHIKVNEEECNTATLKIGDTINLAAYAIPKDEGKTCCQKYFTYATNNRKIVKVYTDGTVQALANGTANITVNAGDGSGKKTTFKVVVAQPVTSVSISSKNGQTRLGEGRKLQLAATVNSDAANKKIWWSLKDPEDAKYATVDKNGNVTAAKLGDGEFSHNVTFVAVPQDGSNVSSEKTITIVPLITEIKSDIKKLELFTPVNGEPKSGCEYTQQFYVSVKSKDKYLEMKDNLNITSSNANVATVGWNGNSYVVVTAVGPGKATVTLAANEGSGKSVKIEVTVKTPVQSIVITEKASRNAIYPGGSLNMIATVNEGASNQVEWHIDTSNLHDDSYWSSDSNKKKPLVDNEDYIKIDPKTGKLTVDKKIIVDRNVIPQKIDETYKNRQTMGYVEVYATAKDGSGKESEKKYKVYINPQKMTHMAYANEEVKVTTDPNDSYNYLLYQKIVKNGYIEEYNNRFSVISVNKPDIVEVKEIPRMSYDEFGNPQDSGYDTYLQIKGKKAGTAAITVVSCDGAVKKTIKCTVVNPVKNINLRAKNGERYVVSGSTFNMEAFTNADATNKKVIWSLSDGAPATIDQKGKVTVNPDYDENNNTFKVTATAADGSGVYNSASFTVYNKYNKICASVSGNTCTTYTIKKGEAVTITFKPDVNTETATGLYKVYYTKKSGYVEYISPNVLVNLNYTKIKVTGTAKGTIPLTIKACDNSGKTLKFNVTVID